MESNPKHFRARLHLTQQPLQQPFFLLECSTFTHTHTHTLQRRSLCIFFLHCVGYCYGWQTNCSLLLSLSLVTPKYFSRLLSYIFNSFLCSFNWFVELNLDSLFFVLAFDRSMGTFHLSLLLLFGFSNYPHQSITTSQTPEYGFSRSLSFFFSLPLLYPLPNWFLPNLITL